jgi:CBS domain-containing protein
MGLTLVNDRTVAIEDVPQRTVYNGWLLMGRSNIRNMTNAKCLDSSREGSMNASDIMITDVTTATPNATVQEVAEMLASH